MRFYMSFNLFTVYHGRKVTILITIISVYYYYFTIIKPKQLQYTYRQENVHEIDFLRLLEDKHDGL